jgi:hypothetical protein
MKRRHFLQTSLALPLAAGCSAMKPSLAGPGLVDTPEKRASYLAGLLKELCTDLGPHPSGSPEDHRAAQIIKREMERSLPVVDLDTLTFTRWVLKGKPEFSIGGKQYETYPAHGTSGTPLSGLTGILKKSGPKEKIPYTLADSSGKTLARVAISESWATGLAVSRPYQMYDKEPGGLPTFNLGVKEIPFLDAAVSNGTSVRVKAVVEFIPNSTTSNVIGTIPGEIPGDARGEIILFAHYDTVYNSPGANDNTASVIVPLMIAHSLANSHPKYTLTFMATAGEEYNYLGTIHYAARRKKEGTLGSIKLLMNLDSITWGQNMEIGTQTEKLWNLIQQIDQELNIPGTPVLLKSDGLGREAQPFKDAGVKGLGMVMGSNGYPINALWHRPEDTAASVPVDAAEISFLLFSEFMKRVQDEI